MITFKKALPKTPMALSDYLAALKDEKADIQTQLRKVNKEIDRVEGRFIEVMQSQGEGQDQVRGQRSRSSLTETTHYNISDWNKLTEWVKRTGNFDVFQRRVSKDSVETHASRARGKRIPGVSRFVKIGVSTTSFRRKKK